MTSEPTRGVQTVRYTVRGPIEGRIDDYYVMEHGEELTFFDLQSQAEICAWAFNAIAEGKELCSTDGHYECQLCQTDTITDRYSGPTEGVGTR